MKFLALMTLFSAEKAVEHYGAVHLVTDSQGARWLDRRLRVPYATIDTGLDAISPSVPGHFWSYGKLAAYSLQREPFLHIDHDVFLLRRLPPRLLESEMFAHSIERGPAWTLCYESYVSALSAAPWLPAWWRQSGAVPASHARVALNAAVVGGDPALLRPFALDAMRVVHAPANRRFWSSMLADARFPPRFWAATLEQYALQAFCAARDLAPPTLFRRTSSWKKVLADGFHRGYWHLTGSLKLDSRWKQVLHMRVSRDAPHLLETLHRAYPGRREWESTIDLDRRSRALLFGNRR
jgi:hypothetical protein